VFPCSGIKFSNYDDLISALDVMKYVLTRHDVHLRADNMHLLPNVTSLYERKLIGDNIEVQSIISGIFWQVINSKSTN